MPNREQRYGQGLDKNRAVRGLGAKIERFGVHTELDVERVLSAEKKFPSEDQLRRWADEYVGGRQLMILIG